MGEGVSARPSTLPSAGLGLFADRGFARREAITFYDGALLWSRREVDAASPRTHLASASLAPGSAVIDGLREPVSGRGGGSFANDPASAADRNAAYSRNGHDSIALIATRDIAAGEEVFVSYGQAYWRTHGIEPARLERD